MLIRPLHFAALTLCVAAAAAAQPVLKSGASINIPASPGKFDFLEVDPAAHRLLAGHEKDGTADFFDLDTNQLIARVKVGPAVGVTVDPKTGRYFASVQDDKRIAIIDGKTFKETGSIALPGESDAILFDAKDRRIYITNDNGKALWAVDPDAEKVIATIPVVEGPECMAHDPAADRIYLNSKVTNQVSVINTKTNSVVTTWLTAPAVGPHGLVLDAAHGRIFVSGDNGLLVALDTKTGKVVASTPIVEHVDQIAFDAGLRRIYCAGPGAMSVVQASDDGLKTLGKIETNATAKNVAVDPKTHAVWTTFTNGKDSFAKSWMQE
jgi:DNA-binding beta-propeller fold protein YncE